MQDNSLSLVPLSLKSLVGMLHGGNLLSVSRTFFLEIFSDTLLEYKCFKSIVTLSLSTRKTECKPSSIILLLVDETGESTILSLVRFNLDTELSQLLVEG